MTRALWEVTVAWEAGVKRSLSSDEGRREHGMNYHCLYSSLSSAFVISYFGLGRKNKDAVLCILNFKSLAGEMAQG